MRVGEAGARLPTGTIDLAKLIRIQAVIDTGATASCVSKALAQHLGLVPHGKTMVGVVGGTTELDQASVLIAFPRANGNGFIFKIIPVAIGDIPVPMLFGMRELAPGVLIVDAGAGTWSWKVRNSTLHSTQAQAPSQPTPTAQPPGQQP